VLALPGQFRYGFSRQKELPNLGANMKLRTILFIYLVVLAIVDMVIPVPIMGLILMYVLLKKPVWFKKSVLEIYND
jgi:hypothetical protein